MQIVFTGATTKEETLFNSLYDGELILHDKHHRFINLFAIFDVYYVKGEDVRHLKFVNDETDKDVLSRNKIVNTTITILKPTSIMENEISPIRIESKKFYPEILKNDDELQIFVSCNHITEKVNNGLME